MAQRACYPWTDKKEPGLAQSGVSLKTWNGSIFICTPGEDKG